MISGFTFIKNGLSLGYPIKESIQSIEPLCDEIIINVGFDDPELKNDDGTLKYLQNNFSGPKFKYIYNYWDPEINKKGLILSQQTNLALEQCQGDFCQYIQGDEVIHEDDLENLKSNIEKMKNDKAIEGLVFDYLHFYANVNIVRKTRTTYRREIRLIRNGLGVQSWLDAQGFKHKDETKLNCILASARIFHYGWCRADMVMKKKVQEMDKLFHGDNASTADFQYKKVWGLHNYNGSHPKLMAEWIRQNRNDIDLNSLKPEFDLKNLRLMLSDKFEQFTNVRLGEYQNYKLK
jgi:hypothetical protein